MKSENFVVIQGWMRTELDLKGNDLFVYAIIYGFSQDGETEFTGSLQYLADWCGATKQGIQKNLKSLLDKGLIEKHDYTNNGVKFCSYSCTPCNSVVHPIQLSCTNNIDNNIDNKEDIITINSNDMKNSEESDFDTHSYSPEELKSDFLGSAKQKSPTKRKSLYSKCIDAINDYTVDLKLQDALTRYLSVRLTIKEKPLYGVNQWTGLLNKLSQTDGDKIKIVEQSIEKGWCSFYPLKSDNKSVFSEGTGVSCEQAQDTAEERKAKLQKQGRRAGF